MSCRGSSGSRRCCGSCTRRSSRFGGSRWCRHSGHQGTNLATLTSHDVAGNPIGSIDPAGVFSTATFDRRGNLTSSTANATPGATPTFTVNVSATAAYDDRDELLASCAPQRILADSCNPATPSTSAWRYAYDVLGHMATETPPDNASATDLSATTYEYDTSSGGGRLVRTCDSPASGTCASATRYTTQTYDALARPITTTTYQGAPSGTEKLRTTLTYNAAGDRTKAQSYVNGTLDDTLDFGIDALGRESTVGRGGTTITTNVFNPDGSLASRTDQPISASASSFTYDSRGRLTGATSPLFSGTVTTGWRLDDLIASRTWPVATGTNAATWSYDAAKRPTAFAELRTGSAQLALSQSYDRQGNVTSDARTFSCATADACTNSQSFGYDRLRRLTSSSLNGVARSYAYDASSNRTSVSEGATTTTYQYDRTDVQTQKTVGSTVTTFGYDAYGNLTSSAVTAPTQTVYGYDLADRLLTIDPPGASNTTTYTIDALGRHASRSLNGASPDSLVYAGSGEAVVRIDGPTVDIDTALDASGSRLATASGGTMGWTAPDLHGSVAAVLAGSGASISDAFRYDGYGETIASLTSSLPSPWRYQGRLLLNSASQTDLYDFVARAYDPALGAFTGLDTTAGSAQDPITLNRYLYAGADPATLIDPDGHCATFGSGGGFDLFGTLGNCGGAVLGFGWGLGESATDLAGDVVGFAGQVKDAGLCAANTSCWGAAADTARQGGAAIVAGARDFARDPADRIRSTISKAAFAAADWAAAQHHALTSGGGFEGGRTGAHILAGVEVTGFAVIGVVGAVKAAPAAIRALPGALTRVGDLPGFVSRILADPDAARRSLIRTGESYVPEWKSGIPGGTRKRAISIGTALGYVGPAIRWPFHLHIYLDKDWWKVWNWFDKPEPPKPPQAPKGPNAL